MEDAGSGIPAPTDRRYTNEQMWKATEQIIDAACLSDKLGFDSFWLTEHHFQYEGYEVVPNGILLGTVIAERTEQIRIGMAFNIVPQWHPLRLAEDFATLHNISGGRGILGVGRGTVPREAETLGSKIGSFDNPDQASADDLNRKQFEEAMDVIQLALNEELFSYHGEVYDFPPPGIPDRGGTVQELTLVPRPLHPYETWQAITSPPPLKSYLKKVGEEFFGIHILTLLNFNGTDLPSCTKRHKTSHWNPVKNGCLSGVSVWPILMRKLLKQFVLVTMRCGNF